jgi:hypothetical protein
MRRTAALPSHLAPALAALVALALPACGLLLDTSPPDPVNGTPDAGFVDADTFPDAGRDDAGMDAGPVDAGFDSGFDDAGFDAGPDDAGFDAGPLDAGFDAGPRDAGFDAGPCVDFDDDRDGVTTCDGDCDDGNVRVFPGFTELCNDGLDNDCDPSTPDMCREPLGTYVSARTGNDTNPGTPTSPVRTIGTGIAHALALGGPQTVVVGEGTYPEKVILEDGVSLWGGFRCADALCDWGLDPSLSASTIQNVDAEGVRADAGVSEDTIVEDFIILGATPPPPMADVEVEVAGITLRGGAPTIRDNRIDVLLPTSAMTLPPTRVVGVSVQATDGGRSAQIVRNQIRTGPAATLSTPIRFNGRPGALAVARVEGNRLQPGEAPRSIGLVAYNSDRGTEVIDNDFLVGSSGMGVIHGIEVGSTLRIARNRIHVPDPAVLSGPACSSTAVWCAGIAGIASSSATLEIENNVIFGPPGPRSTALLLGEFEGPAGAVFVSHNLLDGGGGAALFSGGLTPDKSAAIVLTTGACASCTSGAARVGEIHNNILLGGSALARYGVYEDPVASGAGYREVHPVSFLHNLFHFPLSTPSTAVGVLYRITRLTMGSLDMLDIAIVNTSTTFTTGGNLVNDPLLDPTRHLLSRSPCIDTGTPRGSLPFEDFEGDSRPRGAGYDIGPDEY